jgi:hypothetical protein
MALGNKKSNEQTNNTGTPAFEDEGGTAAAVQEKPAATSADAQAANDASPVSEEAKVTTSTAIAKAASTAVSVDQAKAAARAFTKELDDMRGANDFSYGNYRVFKAVQGEIQETGGEEESLGKWAKVRLMGWDNHFEVSPGEQGASTKDFVAYSKDGKTIDSVIGEELKTWVGKPVADYLDYLRDDKEGEGFANAKCREFIDTAVALIGTESGDGPIGTVVQVTLSESSMMAFNRSRQTLQDAARAAAMGIPGFTVPEDPFTFYYVREAAQKGDNKWTKLKVLKELPVKI